MSLDQDGVPEPGNIDLEADPILDEEISRLQTHIEKLTVENDAIRDKIDNTSGGISSYISEMSTLIDSQELSSLFSSMEVNSGASTVVLSSNDNQNTNGPAAA